MSDREDVSEPNNIFIGFGHDPVAYVLSKRQALAGYFGQSEWLQPGRQFPEPSTKVDGMGSVISQFARHLPLYRCLSTFVFWLRNIPTVAVILRFANVRI